MPTRRIVATDSIENTREIEGIVNNVRALFIVSLFKKQEEKGKSTSGDVSSFIAVRHSSSAAIVALIEMVVEDPEGTSSAFVVSITG